MNEYLSRQLIADRQTALAASMRRRAQVRQARAARRTPAANRPLLRIGSFRFTVRRAAAAVLS